ncbi:serine protease-like protein 8 [Dermatophagoides farinae]|uniref:Serine protease-like protein 8 n=2 Tax=Dermatophagoides farinae TaxID=6954 RepID=A0A9D4NS53_DERFA|nr:serine protease-like protein 8 [Dermatophagoides farinae]
MAAICKSSSSSSFLLINCILLITCVLANDDEFGTRPLRLKRFIKSRSTTTTTTTTEAPDPIEQEIDDDIPDEQFPPSSSTNNTNEPISISVPDCGRTRFFSIDRIVNGRPASPGQFPWQVFLRISTRDGDMVCGGSIISPRWILTAAHCVTSEQTGSYSAQAVEVVAGSLIRGGHGDSRRISRNADCAFKHPGWRGVRGQFTNDIALIRLPKNNPLRLTYQKGGNINAICLPPKRSPPFDYRGAARVAGWGLTRDRGVLARTLQYTDINVISDSECRRYQYPVNIANSMVCQGVENSAPCQGDSGGPLIIRQGNQYVQFGLVSFGPGICNNGRIPNTVFTQVSYYLDWIENTIRQFENRDQCR